MAHFQKCSDGNKNKFVKNLEVASIYYSLNMLSKISYHAILGILIAQIVNFYHKCYAHN